MLKIQGQLAITAAAWCDFVVYRFYVFKVNLQLPTVSLEARTFLYLNNLYACGKMKGHTDFKANTSFKAVAHEATSQST